MITQSESGLSVDDYNALLAANADPVRRYTIERYQLNFSAVSNGFNVSGRFFDADVVGDAMIRAYIDSNSLWVERSTTATSWGAPSAIATGMGYMPITIGVEGDTARVFYLNTDGYVWYIESTDEGASWASPVQGFFVTPAAELDRVTHLAATSLECVYWNSYEAETGINYMQRERWTGAVWTTDGTDWGWTAPFTGFDAIRLSDYDDTDLVVISGQILPLIGHSVEKGGLVQTLYPRGGLVSFTVTARTGWSVHKTIDIFDDWDEYQRRDNVRLSRVNDYIFATARGRDGSPAHYEEAMMLFQSKDGINWSRPTLAHVDTFYGAPLLFFNEQVHLVDGQNHYASDSTAYTGYLPVALTQDITDYVQRSEVTLGGIASATLSLQNPEGALDETLLLSGQALRLRIEYGYWVDEDPILLQRALMNVERVGETTDGINFALDLSARGIITQMSDDMRSPSLVERQGQAMGVDLYDDDDTETGYSGLRHTAARKGTWKTKDGMLYLASNNQRGVAFSTFETDIQNGAIRAQMDWSKPDEDEFMGFVFWAYDDSNYWAVVFVDNAVGGNTWEVWRIMKGRKTQVESFGASGISLGDNFYYQIRVLYGMLDILFSEDGLYWESLDFFLLPNHIEKDHGKKKEPVIKPLINTGSMGLIGRGYAPEDIWPTPSFSPYPQIRTPGDDWDGPQKPPVINWPPGTPKGDGLHDVRSLDDLRYIFTLAGEIDIARVQHPVKPFTYRELMVDDASDDGGGQPYGGDGWSIVHMILDPWAPHWRMYFVQTEFDNRFWVYEMVNIRGPVGQQRFRLLGDFSVPDMVTPTSGQTFVRLWAHPKIPGYLVVSYTVNGTIRDTTARRHWLWIRNGYFSGWQFTPIEEIYSTANQGFDIPLTIGISPYVVNVYNGRMLIGMYPQWDGANWTSRIYESLDMGRSLESTPVWELVDPDIALAPAQIIIPDLEDPDNDFWYAAFATLENTSNWVSGQGNIGLIRYDNGVVTDIAPEGEGYQGSPGEFWFAPWVAADVWANEYSAVVVYPGDHNIIALVDLWGTFYRSTDAGDTWFSSNTDDVVDGGSGLYTLFATTLRGNPNNPLEYIICGQEGGPSSVEAGLWYTRDGGVTWDRVPNEDARKRQGTAMDDATAEYFEALWWK